jgi:hypothetical protein
VAREPEYPELIHVAIRLEMKERLNRLNHDRCNGYASLSDLVRDLLDVALTYHGYPSPQAQQQHTVPQPAPSPFQAPINGKVAVNG